MTTIPNFDIATDIKVEIYAPNAASNVFILGVSELGSDDVLGGDGTFILGYSTLGGTEVLADGSGDYAFVWQHIEAEVSRVETELGGTIQSNVSFTPEPGSANITMQSWTYDPTNNSSIRSGTQIRVRLDDGVVNTTLFNGYIDSVSVKYIPDGPNLISIRAFDGHKRLVNKRLDSFDTTGYGVSCTPRQQILTLAAAAGYSLSVDSTDPAGLIPTTSAANTIANTYLNDALEVGLAVFWINPQTGDLELRDRPQVSIATETTYVVGNNHPATPGADPYHLCMSDIKVDSNQDSGTNSLRVSLTSDSATYVVVKDQDSIDLYGELAQDVDINTTSSTELTRWANAAFPATPTKSVHSVETPAKDRQGTLTQAAFFTPGTPVGVNYQTTNLEIVDYYTTTKVSHSIDVNNWFTTLELWKEF